MEKVCPHCGKIFETDYPTKIYCGENCARQARFERDESYYEFPHEPDTEPLFTFECANCGKLVKVYSKYDQRVKFCCGICAKKYHCRRERVRLAKPRGSNLGMSGGMSLGSLIRREARSVDKDAEIEIGICRKCGKHFEKRRANQKYCSVECEVGANGKKK